MSEKVQNLSFLNRNSDFLNYCPFELGLLPSEIGLRRLQQNTSASLSLSESQKENHKENHKEKIFQFPPDHECNEYYLNSKKLMQTKYPDEFYHNSLTESQSTAVLEYLATKLSFEYPANFSFDSLTQGLEDSMSHENLKLLGLSILEDFCLLRVGDLKVMCIHLASPNDWTAKWGMSKDFTELHLQTPRAFEIVKHPQTLFKRIYDSGFIYERLGAMTLTSYPYLLRHPTHKEELLSENNGHFYFRFERQTLSAIPETGLALFTIRPYLMDFTEKLETYFPKKELLKRCRDKTFGRYQQFIENNINSLT